jgi:IMP dehydrogenase
MDTGDPLSSRVVGRSYTYDDLGLEPAYSEITPDQVDISVVLPAGQRLGVPVLSAAMDTVSGPALVAAVNREGGLGVLHRNHEIADQVHAAQLVQNTSPPGWPVAAAVGVGPAGQWRAESLIQAGATVLIIDSAHGHSAAVIEQTAWLRRTFPDINVVTAVGARALADAGAHIIKTGIGAGSICSTRVVAGVGIGNLTAIAAVAATVDEYGALVCADGGLRYSGDIVKALAAGADLVMLGRMLSGCDEAPGERVVRDGCTFKVYRGMGSAAAMATGQAADRYGSNNAHKTAPEGVSGFVQTEGPVTTVLSTIAGGIRAGLGYCGAANIAQLQASARFMELSPATQAEGRPHSLYIWDN